MPKTVKKLQSGLMIGIELLTHTTSPQLSLKRDLRLRDVVLATVPG